MIEEFWIPHPRYEGLRVSTWGRVWLPPRRAMMPSGVMRSYETHPRRGCVAWSKKGAKHTYRNLQTRRWGTLKIHRLICEAFHGPPPEGRPVVIHKDEDAHNNTPENLKWGTQKENLNAPGFIEYCKGRTGENSPTVKGRQR